MQGIGTSVALGGRGGSIERRGLRLGPGSHGSPREGVCVMELAALLAGERFSDRPRCVCPVIAAFLRAWNDRLGYADRQRLLPCAEMILDSRSDRATTRLRRDFCLVWAGADLSGGIGRRFGARVLLRWRIAVLVGLRPALRLDEGAAELAARTVFAELGSGAAFRLLEGLLSAGDQAGADPSGLEAAPLPDPVARAAQPRIAAPAGELVGNAKVANREKGRQRQHDRRQHGDFARRHIRKRDKEDIEGNRAGGQQPEREPHSTEDLHALEASGRQGDSGSSTTTGICRPPARRW